MEPDFLIGPGLTVGALRERLNKNGIPFLEPHTTPVKRVRRVQICPDAIFGKTNGKCWFCGKAFGVQLPDPPTVDPLIPQCKGGSSKSENLVPACRRCNADKGDLDIEAFRQLEFGGKPFYGEATEAP